MRALAHQPEKPRAWVFAVAANIARDEARATYQASKPGSRAWKDAAADLDMAERITRNSKCQRTGVCNAAETLLVHADVADRSKCVNDGANAESISAPYDSRSGLVFRRSAPTRSALREIGDQIELLMPHELWPLPKYREMLFPV